MAVHSKSVKRIMSIIRQTFPDAGEIDILEKMNDSLVHAGKFNVKYESATADLTTDKRRYTLSDSDSGIEVMKIRKVSIMDTDGDYIRIRRLGMNDVALEDVT